MELKITEKGQPMILEANFDELKAYITEKAEIYKSLVYSEDQLKDAKADRANLNKLKKSLNDERIKREKEYMQPFNEFKAQINEIIDIIDRPIMAIDTQLAEFEARKKDEKEKAIKKSWETSGHPAWLELSQIWNKRWLNASVSLAAVEKEIEEKLKQIKSDVDAITHLPEFGFEAMETYKSTLNLSAAIAEGRRLSDIQKRKEEAKKAEEEKPQTSPFAPEPTPTKEEMEEVKRQAEQIENPRYKVKLEIEVTMTQAKELRAWLDAHGIKARQI